MNKYTTELTRKEDIATEKSSFIANKLIDWGWTNNSYSYVKKYEDGTESICETHKYLEDEDGNRIILRKNYLVLNKGKDYNSGTIEALYDNVELETFAADSEGLKVDKCLVIKGVQQGKENIVAKIYNPNVVKDRNTNVVFLYEVSHIVRTTQYIYANNKQEALEKYKESIGTSTERETTSTEYEEVNQIVEYHGNILLD